MKLLLPKLTARLKECREGAERLPVPRYKMGVPEETDDKISHTYFWPRMAQFFREEDVIVAETGKHSAMSNSFL